MTTAVLVTGAAGFVGGALCDRLLARGERVVGLDNLSPYYDPDLKRARLARLEPFAASGAWRFVEGAIEEASLLPALFEQERFDRVVHLAAQAGVRHSITNPAAYIQTNLLGFSQVLEACRMQQVAHLVYASSSSVYGGNTQLPFSESQPVNHPVSLYAATKKANELMAHSYSHLYGLPATGLRLFTVYGPWGRPDMAPMLFARAILAGEPIRVFNHGAMWRDFTYIDDIVEGLVRCLDQPATPNPEFDPAAPDPATSWAPHRLFNLGNSEPVELLRFIGVLEAALNRRAVLDLQPMQPGDVKATAADTSRLQAWVGFRPSTSLEQGVERFARWYLDYHGSGQVQAAAARLRQADSVPFA